MKIRRMTDNDIGLGLELCRLAGWNQVEADWRRLLALGNGGVFVAECDGVPCATGTTTAYGRETAWIGMILVHPDFRRRGIGTAIMDRCIEHLRSAGIESIKLDATEQGRPVYLKLGFRDERPIYRYRGRNPEPAPHEDVRAIESGDWSTIARVDREAFGAGRLDLLRILATEGPTCVVVGGDDSVRAYGFARVGHQASFVGPVVANDAEGARAVIETLLAGLPEGEVFWDLMPENEAARQLAESLGFTVVRRLVRMYLGDRMNPGEVDRMYAAAGFELG